MRLQAVSAAQQRGLARAGGADDDRHLALAELRGHALEHLVRAKGLGDPLADDVGGAGVGSVRSFLAALHVKAVLDGGGDLGHQRGQHQVGDAHGDQRLHRLEGGRLDAVAHVGQLHHANRVGQR